MLFYDVELLTIPKIKYNCAAVSENHHVHLGKNARLIELCYIERGGCILRGANGTVACEQGHLYPLLFTQKCEMYADDDEPVRTYSVGFECDFALNRVNSEDLSEDDTRALMKNLLSGNRFLLPAEGLSSFACDWLLPYMKKIISCKTGERIGEETRAVTLILDFMSKITKSCMDTLAFDAKAFPTSAVAYSEMVVAYIAKNYRQKISVIDIAEEFGLSPNYLHAIFKQVKGTTIIDYLTTYRMDMVRTYIERFGLRAYEAAEMVGIDDPAYFSRVFKKLYGKSISEFKKQNK